MLFILCFAPFTQGCAVYDGVAYFHDTGELLDVKIDKNLRSKMASVEARGADGLVCNGALRTVHQPPPFAGVWTCKGEEGKIALACNDGRHLMGVWNAENCSTGQAAGGDQYGNTFVLAYGDVREEALLRAGAGPDGPMPSFYDGGNGLAAFAPAQTGRGGASAPRGSAGVFVSADGRVATSSAGLGKNDAVSVYLPAEQSELPARVLAVDLEDDVAILKVEAEGAVGSAVRVIIRKERPKAGTGHYR